MKVLISAAKHVGLITYMRTDGVALSTEAIAAARDVIAKDFGATYVPDAPRIYKNTAKNAQEAHEAIRPTDMNRRPEQVTKYLDGEQLRALHAYLATHDGFADGERGSGSGRGRYWRRW